MNARPGWTTESLRRLGRTEYTTTWRAMQAFTASRDAATPDEIWLTEHPPVYTVGLAGRPEHFPRDNGERNRSPHDDDPRNARPRDADFHRISAIPLIRSDRGGQITYHGPGQIVAYTLVDLRRLGIGVREYVRRLESGIISLLAEHGVESYGKVDAPGVYVRSDRADDIGGEAKIGALGLKVRNGCTYHGVALNVDMDLSPFAAIDPCGYAGLKVTQTRDMGIDDDAITLADALGKRLQRALQPG